MTVCAAIWALLSTPDNIYRDAEQEITMLIDRDFVQIQKEIAIKENPIVRRRLVAVMQRILSDNGLSLSLGGNFLRARTNADLELESAVNTLNLSTIDKDFKSATIMYVEVGAISPGLDVVPDFRSV